MQPLARLLFANYQKAAAAVELTKRGLSVIGSVQGDVNIALQDARHSLTGYADSWFALYRATLPLTCATAL